MTLDEYSTVQFFVEDNPKLSVAEVSVKRVENEETREESLVFRCTCSEFSKDTGCKHVKKIILNIQQRGDGRYVTPMLPTTNDRDIERAIENPAYLRELLLRKSIIRYLPEEEEDDDGEG